MKFVLVLVLLFFSPNGTACTWAGDPPKPEDHIEDFNNSVSAFDVIFRGRVIYVDGNVATIRVDEVFKGADRLLPTIQYESSTTCDEHFSRESGDSLFFGGYYEDKLYIPAGNGFVPSESVVFSELLSRLQKHVSKLAQSAA